MSEVSDNTRLGTDLLSPTTGGDFLVPSGGTLVMEGSISGVESVQWRKDGRPLAEDNRITQQVTQSGGSRLIVGNVRQSDSGTYSLYGENDAGIAETSADIVVQGMLWDRVIKRLRNNESCFRC